MFRTSRGRAAFTLIELLVVIAIIAILVALLLPAVQQVREAARKSQCQDHQHNLAIALHDYEASHKTFPGNEMACVSNGSTAMNCWEGWSGFAMLLPFVEQKPLYDQADFGRYWDTTTPNNRRVNRAEIDVFLCPSDPVSGSKPNASSGPASYALSAGPVATWHVTNGPGPFSRQSSTRMASITDGTSNTIATGEVKLGDWRNTTGNPLTVISSGAGALNTATGTGNNRVFDTRPANVAAIRTYHANCKSLLASYTPSGDDARAGRFWASGRVAWGPWFNTLMPPNTFPHCDENTSVTTMDIKNASSYHPGGAQVAMFDAKIIFVSENVDQGVWIGAGSMNGGETSQLR